MDAYFVFRCFTGREKLACEQLAQQGVHALAPRTRTFERLSRKRIMATDAPLFPGYVFAKVGADQWPKLQEVPLVSRHPLLTDGRPHKLSAADVAYLQELALNPPRDPRDPKRIGVGDRVSVIAGPLQGVGGTVAALVGRHVQMLADVLGRLTISPDYLEFAGARS
jgi:transcription antitermination factor NusG